MVCPVSEANPLQFLERLGFGLFVPELFNLAQPEFDIVKGGQVIEEQKVLKNHADVLADLVFIMAWCRDFIFIEPDLPRIGLGQQVDAA